MVGNLHVFAFLVLFTSLVAMSHAMSNGVICQHYKRNFIGMGYYNYFANGPGDRVMSACNQGTSLTKVLRDKNTPRCDLEKHVTCFTYNGCGYAQDFYARTPKCSDWLADQLKGLWTSPVTTMLEGADEGSSVDASSASQDNQGEKP